MNTVLRQLKNLAQLISQNVLKLNPDKTKFVIIQNIQNQTLLFIQLFRMISFICNDKLDYKQLYGRNLWGDNLNTV